VPKKKKTPPKSPPKEKKSHHKKPPEVHPIYKQMDEAPLTNPADKGLLARVAGISFTDYTEVKFLGGDGIHDPFIDRNMGVKIPKNYQPRMVQEPISVSVQNNNQLLIKKFTAADYSKVGNMGQEQEYVIKDGHLTIPFFNQNAAIFAGATNPTPLLEKKIIWPKYYQNPYQYQDYIYLQDIYANTICGRIFDTLGYFVLANGVQPKIKVRYESEWKTDEDKRKALDEHKWMVDELKQIDRNISTSSQPKAFGVDSNDDIESVGPYGTALNLDTPTYDTTLQKKWFAAFINGMMFGRECIVPRIDPDDNEVRIKRFDEAGGDGEDVEFKNIPKIQLVIHPRDMGFNYVDYKTHRLLGLQLNNSNWILKPDEMTFWEWMPDNPVYGSKFYGMSAAQSMMGASRTLRRIIEVDFPLIAKTRWSGMYWLVFKRKGEQLSTSDEELRRILANVELNGINATLEEDPEKDFKLHKIDLDPKIQELLQTVKDLIQYMMSQIGIPQGLLYGEQDLNRDTLSKKISTFVKGPVKKYRSWFLEPITLQHYGRLVLTLAEQDDKWKKALEHFEVVADVEEFRLEDLAQQIQTLIMLENAVGPFKDEAKAEFLDMPDLPDMIDPDKGPEDVPQIPGGRGFQVTDNENGKTFGVSENRG